MTQIAARRTPENDRQDRRFDRYRVQRTIAKKILCGWSIERCGKIRFDNDYIWVKRGSWGAHYSGLGWCGSIWTCPVCAQRIARGRRKQVRSVIDGHLAGGGVVYMATFTIPHHLFQSCGSLLDGVREAWKSVVTGREWQDAKARAGLTGFVRAIELTHGENGWHPHLHVLFFFDTDDRLAVLPFGAMVFDRWSNRIADMNFGKCNPEVWRFEQAKTPDAAGEYVAKWGPDAELVSGHTKKGRNGGRGPFQIAMDFADNKDPRDAALFREFAEAFKGARQLTWSRGLKDLYTDKMAEDADLANAEPPAEKVVRLHWREWQFVVEKGLQTAVLEAVETLSGLALLVRLEYIGLHSPHIMLPGLAESRPEIRILED